MKIVNAFEVSIPVSELTAEQVMFDAFTQPTVVAINRWHSAQLADRQSITSGIEWDIGVHSEEGEGSEGLVLISHFSR